MDNVANKLEVFRRRFAKDAAEWTNEDVTVGEFTYGRPIVHDWHNGSKLSIGKFCSIGGNVNILLGGEHHTEWCTTYPFDVLLDGSKGKSKGDVKIGNDVWIGDSVLILSGVTIGDGAVIGAGSVVTKDVPMYTIVGGNPAMHIRERFELEQIDKLIEMQWWLWPIEAIAEASPMLMSGDVDGLYEYWAEEAMEWINRSFR